MKSFRKQVDRLEFIVLEKENYSKGRILSEKIIKKYPVTDQLEAIESYISSASMCVELPEDISIHRDITQWLYANYRVYRSLRFADLILSWLNEKLEFDELDEVSEEARLSLSLFDDILGSNQSNEDDDVLTNYFQGHATYSLLIGVADSNKELINQAIASQRKVLDLYENGKFPDYRNIAGAISGAKRSLGSCLMDAIVHDKGIYAGFYKEAGALLHEAAKEYESSGTDFDKGYSKDLVKEYDSLSL